MSTVVTPQHRLASRRGERAFFLAMAIAILAAVVVGFSRSFYLHALFPARPVPPEPFFMLHGAVFTAWFGLLLVQSTLVSTERTTIHRQVGWFGAGLAASMVLVGLYGALIAGHRAGGFVGIAVPGWQFMIVPVVDMVMFSAFVSLAIRNRRDPQAHKRWMLIASISILTAAIARWPGVQETGNPLVFFAVADLFLVPLLVRDGLVLGRLHSATLWGGLALVVSQPLRLALSATAAWHAVAQALIGLVS